MKPYSRRELLIQSGRGFGALALAGMLEAASPNNPLAPKAAAFSGARQSRDPSLHARRREPRGHLRSQARTGQTQRRDHLRGDGQGPQDQSHRFRQGAHAGQPLEVPALRPVRAWRSRSCSPASPPRPTRSPSSAPATATPSTMPPACTCAIPARSFPAGPSLGSWVAYGLGSENQNLPAYVVMSDGAMKSGPGRL